MVRGVMFHEERLERLRGKTIDVSYNVVGAPTTVVGRYDGLVMHMKRNRGHDGRLLEPCKNPRTLGTEGLMELTKTVRETSTKHLSTIAPYTVSDMQMPRPAIREEDLRKEKKRGPRGKDKAATKTPTEEVKPRKPKANRPEPKMKEINW